MIRWRRSLRLWCSCALVALGAGEAFALDKAPMSWRMIKASPSGLPSNVVVNFFQDSYGFVWIATESGLSRYDGYRYSNYYPNSASGLTGNYSWAAVEDARGDLYVSTAAGGLVRYIREADRFQAIALRREGSEETLSVGGILDLAIDAQGHLWIASDTLGLVEATPEGRVLAEFGKDLLGFGGRERQLREVWLYAETVYALVMNHGVYAVNQNTRRIQQLEPGGSKPRWQPTAMAVDKTGNLVVATADGEVFEGNAGETTLRPTQGLPASYSSWVRRVFQDRDGRLWLATDANGLFVRPERSQAWIHMHTGRDADAIPSDVILDVFQDRSGTLWFGTRGVGYFQWVPHSLKLGPHQPPNYSKAHFMGFAERNDGEIWAALLNGGVLRLSPDGEVIGKLRDLVGQDAVPERAACLAAAPDGSVYIGSFDGGLFRIYPDQRVVRIPTPENHGRMAGVMTLYVKGQRVYAGLYNAGVMVVDMGSNDEIRGFLPAESAGLADARVTSIEQHGAEFWFGTETRGLYRYSPQQGVVDVFPPQHLAAVENLAIYDLASVGDALGVATDSSGVLFLRERDGQWQTTQVMDRTSGLQSDTVYGIVPEGGDRYWLSTQHGLARVTWPSLQLETFEALASGAGSEFVFGAHARLRDGQIMFGSTEGFNLFQPASLEFQVPPAELQLTAVELFNQPYRSSTPAHLLTELDLGYADDVVSFEYAALDFIAPAENTYRHRLRGFETEWSQPTPRNFVTYTNLEAGDYVLEVQGFNSMGIPSNTLSLDIHVDPSPWQTWWAYLSYVLTAGTVIWLFLQWRFREQEHEARINQLAFYDQVTGIPNRYLFEARAATALDQALRYGEAFSVLWLRLVVAPQLNDLLSPEQRDEVARALAGRCVRVVHGGFEEPGKRDVARMESLGFAVFVRDDRGGEQAQSLAERLLDVLGRPLTVGEHLVPVAAHIGMAGSPDDGDSLPALMTYAQTATFDAGPRQQSRIVRYRASMTQAAEARVSLESRLRDALDQHVLQVYFQPRLHQDGHITGAEALLRWPVANGPWPSPAEFVPVAEQSDLIGVLDRYVIRQVCANMQRWQQQGLPAIPIAINLSARSLGPDDLVAELQQICTEYGVPAQRLEIELTESAIVADMEHVRRSLAALQGAGCKISLDDFGTGYSSLSHLQAFAIDAVKIDRSFVAEVDSASQPASICQGIISLAHGLGMRVVAEGVETRAQWDTLKSMGCPEMQGYLYAPALPAKEFESVLRDPAGLKEIQR